jgi:hypothetical protein|tara:strand:- start:497 stop:1513 length:1017 start_codon:yes stop_codon:yes gene_type:complete
MKLTDFYRRLNEKGTEKPEGVGCTDPSYLEYSPEATLDDGSCVTKKKSDDGGVGPVEPEEVEDTVLPDDEVVPTEEEPLSFIDRMTQGYSDFGCSFLFGVKGRKETKLLELRTASTNPFWQAQLVEHIEYVDTRIREYGCTESTPEAPTTSSKPVSLEKPVTYVTKETPKTNSISVKKSYSEPKVLPEPLYNTESEVSDISQIQTDKIIDNAIIDLDNQISLQEPEIQEILKRLNITSERLAYVLPLTRETKDFMMGLQMRGINLPHLMVMYNNIKTLYPAIKQGVGIDKKKIKPLNNVVNYKEFWDWTGKLWKNSGSWLTSKFIGTYPELDRSTLLP